MATGKISYGLYLWNFPVSNALQLWDVPTWGRTVALLIVSFAMAALSWYIIERPFMHRPTRVPAATFAEVVAQTAEVRSVRQQLDPLSVGASEPSVKGMA